MSPDLQQVLLNDYADIVALAPRRNVLDAPDSPLMRPTIWCEDGWAPLLRELFEQLRAMGAVERGFRITQITQQLGALSFNWNQLWPDAQQLMNSTIERSLQVCEWCGAPGERRQRLPAPCCDVQTVCEVHAQGGFAVVAGVAEMRQGNQ